MKRISSIVSVTGIALLVATVVSLVWRLLSRAHASLPDLAGVTTSLTHMVVNHE